ncbi:MAG: cyclase family protein [Bacteroidia bacterium]|nr:cyclase family protein [Bacteroidia bacterium]
MEVFLAIAGKNYRMGGQATDLSVPLHFNGPQPNTYGVPFATAAAFEGGGFVGDTRRGGSCNFETYSLTPHCNGTHTECIGHIARERISIRETLKQSLFPATVISVNPQAPANDSYQPSFDPHDRVITRADLELALKETPPEFLTALLIRTLPNPESKRFQDYMQEAPAFFSNQAMSYLTDLGVQHLLVDMPSVDRLFDEGKLSNHHIFWEIPQGSQEVSAESHSLKTITEFIYIPNQVKDGIYCLELQIAPFVADAAPSRPLLYPIQFR